MSGPNLIIGTSGHIDHGKTSLIRSLTGVDLDSAPEEKERGITIALGFTSLTLEEGRHVSFVDVPGHERLVRTMVAGATGIDGVVLCVSAVEGVMPQTREHFEILELLGVSAGVVVITKVDLVDEELLEFAVDDVENLIAGSALEGSPIVPFSAVTGVGRDELLAHLNRIPKRIRTEDGPFRLPIDRVFTRDGFGSIVTGTIQSGSVSRGQDVQLLPVEQKSRIRGLEVHGDQVEQAIAGSRVAINLAGLERNELHRGLVVAKGSVPCSSMVDVRLRILSSAAELKDGAELRVLLGTSERIAKVYLAQDADSLKPGSTVWAQLRLDAPLVCMPGDHFIVRRVSPLDTLGGGVIVDPWAGRMRRKQRVLHGQQIARLYAGEQEVWLERAGEGGLEDVLWQERAKGCSRGVLIGSTRFSEGVVARLEGGLIEELARYHEQYPLSLGPHRRELKRGRLGHLDDKVFDALLERLSRLQMVSIEGPLICVRGHSVELTNEQKALRERLLSSIRVAELEGVAVTDLHKRFPDSEVSALMKLIEANGEVLLVNEVGWVASEWVEQLQQRLLSWFEANEEITPGDFKEISSLTRRRAIPFLEWCDQQRWTRRRGSLRMRGDKLVSS